MAHSITRHIPFTLVCGQAPGCHLNGRAQFRIVVRSDNETVVNYSNKGAPLSDQNSDCYSAKVGK